MQWLNTTLKIALAINDDTVKSALPSIYKDIAQCHRERGDNVQAEKNSEIASTLQFKPSDAGPFYHGTRADLKTGDLLTPGGNSNYKDELKMNHIYFTGLLNGAGLAAALARGEAPEKVYVVVPTGPFENDPNVTDKKFPGNPTRSYRSTAPLKIVGEVQEWPRLTPEELKAWRERLAKSTGEIIN